MASLNKPQNRTIDICIPAFNEAGIIAQTVRMVASALEKVPDLAWRIVVADNGSTDGTGDAVRALRIPNVSVLPVAMRGKGVAVISAARASQADIFGFIDADLSADPQHITEFIREFERGADIVIGSRLHPEARTDRAAGRTFSSQAFNFLRRSIVGINVTDSQCGLKLTNEDGRTLLAACKETGWFFEVEWLFAAERAGLIIRELPVVWQEFHYPDRKSKLRIVKDGIGALSALLRIRRAQLKRDAATHAVA